LVNALRCTTTVASRKMGARMSGVTKNTDLGNAVDLISTSNDVETSAAIIGAPNDARTRDRNRRCRFGRPTRLAAIRLTRPTRMRSPSAVCRRYENESPLRGAWTAVTISGTAKDARMTIAWPRPTLVRLGASTAISTGSGGRLDRIPRRGSNAGTLSATRTYGGGTRPGVRAQVLGAIWSTPHAVRLLRRVDNGGYRRLVDDLDRKASEWHPETRRHIIGSWSDHRTVIHRPHSGLPTVSAQPPLPESDFTTATGPRPWNRSARGTSHCSDAIPTGRSGL